MNQDGFATFATWAVELADRNLHAAAPLRTSSAVRAAVLGERAWVCGNGPDEATRKLIARIPGALFYQVDGDGRLTREHHRLPEGRLPSGPWLPLIDLLPVVCPTAVALAGWEPLRLELAMSGAEQAVAAVLSPWTDLRAWVEQSPAHRLTPLRLARRDDGQALVLGAPLPPLRGRPFWSHGRLLIPCGWALSPPVPESWTERLLDIPADGRVLVVDGQWQHVPGSAWAPLTRALVRGSVP